MRVINYQPPSPPVPQRGNEEQLQIPVGLLNMLHTGHIRGRIYFTVYTRRTVSSPSPSSVHSTRGRVEARPSSVGRISETKSRKSVTSNELANHVVCYMPCCRRSIQCRTVVVRLLAPLELLAPHGRSRANSLAHPHRLTHPFAHPANDEQRIEEPRR